MTRIESNYEANFGLALAMKIEADHDGIDIEAYNAAVATSREDLWPQGGVQTFLPAAAAIYLSSELGAIGAAVADDGGSQTTETTAANNATTDDMTLLPAVPVAGDAYYIGRSTKFTSLDLNVSTLGAGNTIVVEYWNGSDFDTQVPDLVDDTVGFSEAGINRVSFTEPVDWATTTVNSISGLYWIRFRVTVAGAVAIGQQVWVGGDGNVDVTIEYLDANWAKKTATVNTNGPSQILVITPVNPIRINKATVLGSVVSTGKIYIAETDTLTQGVPDTATKIHAVIEVADQETKHGWWSIPVGHEGYIMDWQVDTLAAIIMTNRVEVREFGGVFIWKDRILINAQQKGKTKFKPIVCPPMSDVKLTSIGASGSSLVDGGMSLFIKKL